jgi:hypothetical protein
MLELAPRSGAFVQVDIFDAGFGYFPKPKVVKLVLDPPSRITAVMEVNLTGMSCNYPSENWQRANAPFDSNALLDMMNTTGIDPARPEAIADANEIARIVTAIAAGKQSTITLEHTDARWRSTHINRWQRANRPRWHVAIPYICWLIVTLAIFAWWRRRIEWRNSARLKAAGQTR